ncbi:hypothetical protein HZC31_06705 [Candidatus Woesearchaeota archaeon]|nr:hypothetical protein [Candidatus Woesearchaeota archaeon]
MEQEILQEMGFTQAEAKIYLLLLRQGAVKVGFIIKKTGLQSSTTHNTLHSLIEKGLVTFIFQGKIKIYQAVSPKQLLEQYREKEKKLEDILPHLESLQRFAEEKKGAEVYEGTKGIISMLSALIEDTKPGDVYYFFAMDVSGMNREIQTFFIRYDAKRKAKKLVIKGLARKELRSLFQNRKNLKMKYLDFPIPSNVSICNNKMAFITWGEKPTGILIQSKQLVDSEKAFFHELWKQAI